MANVPILFYIFSKALFPQQTSKQDIDQVFNRTHCRNKYENFNEEQKMVLLTWFKQVVTLFSFSVYLIEFK